MIKDLDPKQYGANTGVDVGLFLAGAAAGGITDALLNSFGFADPLVIAPLTGAAALSAKKLLWDSWHRPGRKAQGYAQLAIEVKMLEEQDQESQARTLRHMLVIGRERGLEPKQIEKMYERSLASKHSLDSGAS